jgi:nitroimidazol reductase NimA-like FMN-containing flavoprotein (pyridoxamine 5'-phosphate oxidase superfamily)
LLELVVAFSPPELALLNAHEVGRLATYSDKDGPHVVPVTYLFQDDTFYVATDYDTKKYRNILANNRVALVIDSTRPNRAVLVQGRAEIIERGAEFRRLYARFHQRFAWVRADPWREGEAPFLKIKPNRKISWGPGPGRTESRI